MAYEAYYVSRVGKGIDDGRNIFFNNKSYQLYKKEADKAFNNAGKKGISLSYWFTLYSTIEWKSQPTENCKKPIKSINNLIKKVILSSAKNENEGRKLLDEINAQYNYLSQDTHGFRTRKSIKLNGSENYIESFRNPHELKNQVKLCHYLLNDALIIFLQHYSIFRRDMVTSIEKQSQHVKKIWGKYDEWIKNENDMLSSLNQ